MKKINKKCIIISIIILLILCLFSVIFAIINIGNNNIIKGVAIDNIDMSMTNKEDAMKKLNELILENKEKEITLKYGEIETKIKVKDVDIEYNVEEAVNKAFSVGRDGNIFVNNFNIIKTHFKKENVDINKNIDINKLLSIINSISENIPDLMENYSYYIEDEELIISKGKPGVTVNKEKLINDVEEAMLNLCNYNVVIDIPVINAEPDKIDIEKIHNEIYKEAQDAYVSENPTTVHPNINGVDFAISLAEAKELIKEDKEEYIIPLKITIANKTLSDLGKEAFPNQLGTFYTKYDISNESRSKNIELATKKIDGTIILPGETFSYNKIVGKRTIEAGYEEAGAYAGGQIVQEVGGGICQVSSTLYNAVLYANLEVTERYNHYFETSYVDAGRDATVSWGTVDFKFKNNRNYPIKIVATAKNGVETISIYGIKENNEEVIIQSKKVSIIERSVKYENDDSLEEGQEVIKQKGHDGCTSETYKIIRKDGEIISNELISKDTYHALDKIIKRGTKEKTTE